MGGARGRGGGWTPGCLIVHMLKDVLIIFQVLVINYKKATINVCVQV